MTRITGYDAHAPPRPFPHPVDRLTRGVIDYDSGNPVRTWRMGRSDSRRPLRRGLFASSWNDGRRRYPRVRRTNGGADHRTRVAWSWLPRRELPTGMESYRAVYGNRTRITGVEDRGADRCANTANRNPQTPYQKADSLADATGFEPGSPPTGGGVLPLHQRPARVMNSVRSPSRDSSGWRPAMDSVVRITRSVFA